MSAAKNPERTATTLEQRSLSINLHLGIASFYLPHLRRQRSKLEPSFLHIPGHTREITLNVPDCSTSSSPFLRSTLEQSAATLNLYCNQSTWESRSLLSSILFPHDGKVYPPFVSQAFSSRRRQPSDRPRITVTIHHSPSTIYDLPR
jgi:hypothetical protein